MGVIDVRAKIERELFYNEESLYGIYSCSPVRDAAGKVKLSEWGNFVIKGNTVKLEIGTEYRFLLKSVTDKYGHGYVINSVVNEMPQTVESVKEFLKAIITETQCNAIYAVYPNENIIKLIESGEFDLSKVKGIGEQTFERIKEKIKENLHMQELLVFLSSYHIPFEAVSGMMREISDPNIIIKKLKENPYQITSYRGYGFIKADKIAKLMGFDLQSPHRILSCIDYLIGESSSNGNSYIEKDDLIRSAIGLLELNKPMIEDQMMIHAQDESCSWTIVDGDKVAIKGIVKAEEQIAEFLLQRVHESNQLEVDIDEFLERKCKEKKVTLTDEQSGFFHYFARYNVNILTASAGCGKSFLQTFVVELLEELGMDYLLLSPTGKAASNLKKYVQRETYTCHRALEANSLKNGEIKEYHISNEVVIIDETSMADVVLAKRLLFALKNPKVRVLFCGDPEQLLSVGIGRLLHDMIESRALPVTMLTKVFRQADDGILSAATQARNGKSLALPEDNKNMKIGNDMVFKNLEQTHMYDGVVYFYKKMLERYDVNEVVVLSPTIKGSVGTKELNKVLQAIANPPCENKREKKYGDRLFREGDNVINIVNTYGIETESKVEVDVFNGDTGVIRSINNELEWMIVDFDDVKGVIYKFYSLKNLLHSYALTIHRSQGSGYDGVILITDKAHTFQLTRNLIYTGMTRTRKFLVHLGQTKTVKTGIRKRETQKRRSFLKEFLESKKSFTDFS